MEQSTEPLKKAQLSKPPRLSFLSPEVSFSSQYQIEAIFPPTKKGRNFSRPLSFVFQVKLVVVHRSKNFSEIF